MFEMDFVLQGKKLLHVFSFSGYVLEICNFSTQTKKALRRSSDYTTKDLLYKCAKKFLPMRSQSSTLE